MKKILLLILFISLTTACFAEEYLELLVSTSDNVPSKKPRGQWDKKLLDEERAGNTKQGYIVAVNPEGFEWGRLEQDPKRYAIVKILKSRWNPEWLEPEYNYDKPIYNGPDEIMAYEVKTMRKYKLPLEKFLSGPEIAALRRIPYNDKEERPPIRKTVEDIEERVVVNDYEKRPPDWVSHGSSGTFTICSSGCDYTAASTWEATENADLTGTGPCIGKITGTWASSDGTGFSITGWTTTASDYIRLYTERSARHDGKYNTSAYRIEGSSGAWILGTYEEYTRLEGLQLKNTTNTGTAAVIASLVNNATSDVRIAYNILCGPPAAGVTRLRGISEGWQYAAVKRIYNNIIYDVYESTVNNGVGIELSGGTAYVYNNTVVTAKTNYSRGGNCTFTAKNNLANDVQTGGSGFSGTFTGSNYNASSDGTSTGGANDRINQTFSFKASGSDDYHLTPNDTGAWNYGTPLYDDFPDDIDGEVRTGNWDIGADEIAEDPMQLGTHF